MCVLLGKGFNVNLKRLGVVWVKGIKESLLYHLRKERTQYVGKMGGERMDPLRK